MRRALLCLVLGVGCSGRALDIPQITQPFDLSGARDFALPVDLALADLTRPHYCDGIYVIDINSTLLFFDPVKLTFTPIGVISCPAALGTSPFSMGLARDGTAWIELSDGGLYRVDSTTAACSATTFLPDQDGFRNFGMGFASNTAGGTDETLFIYNNTLFDGGPQELASVDLQSLDVHDIASVNGGSACEMTGTGTGELWGLFASNPGHVARIDKQTGALSPDVALPQLGDTTQDGFAFGFFGGLFYAFLYDAPGATRVVRIDATKGTADTVLANTGLSIVGAGVSTCAPTE